MLNASKANDRWYNELLKKKKKEYEFSIVYTFKVLYKKKKITSIQLVIIKRFLKLKNKIIKIVSM